MSKSKSDSYETESSDANRDTRTARRRAVRPQAPVGHVDAALDTCRTGENPTLDTLDRLSEDKVENKDSNDTDHDVCSATCQNIDKELSPKNVPNVFNEGNSGVQRLSNAAQRQEAPGDDGDIDDIDVEDAAGFHQAFHSQPVRGVLRVGRMRCSREHFSHFENPDLVELLAEQVPPDTVIEAEKGAEFSVVDVDVHHWSSPPSDELLEAYRATFNPTPEASWISHGRGLKLVYIGPYHAERALAAAFCVPRDMKVELLTRTRHPNSVSTAHEGASCGPVHHYDTDPEQPFQFCYIGPPTRAQREEALQRLDLTDGDRYDHDRCPIDPTADSDAKACVVIIDRGVFCHRCAGHGIHYQGVAQAGFFPFAANDASSYGELDRLAEHRVHWTHARLELKHFFSNLSEHLLRKAYRKVLEARWGGEDPRVHACFNGDLDFVWGAGMWLDATHYQPTNVDNDACAALPPVMDAFLDAEGRWRVKANPTRRSQAKNRTPRGYTPIRPVRGISFAEDAVGIPTPMTPLPRFPIELLADPLPEADALAHIYASFPKLDRRYLYACLAAAICADARLGQPPMLACTGPSGSGKEQHIRLAASFLDDDIIKLPLGDDVESFKRQLGIAITSGHRFIVFDELSKDPRLSERLMNLLQISTRVSWRPLHSNRLVDTDVRAAIYYPCVSFPDFLRNSQEFDRRCRLAELHFRVPNWADTCGGDTCAWRDASAENARAANSILTHVWSICRQHDFQFNGPIAESLGLGRLSDDAPGMEPAFLRRLYRHVRNEDGQRVIFANDGSFRGDWVNLDSPAARTLMELCLAEHSELGTKTAREMVKANLEAQPWSEILGIDDPPIACKIKTHGNRWGIKFQSGHPAMRGHELRNEQLPPSPILDECCDLGGVPTPVASTHVPVPESRQLPDATTADDATDVLRKAGFPS